MSYVVTFIDFLPTRRFDDEPWNRIKIEESTASDGPWTELETQTLTPLDNDPTDPMARDFSTALATLESGWYRITFLDADDNAQPTDPIFNDITRDNYLPAKSDVGAIIRARTKDTNGAELGTFNENTRPTGDEVDRIIDKAAFRVQSRVGTEIPEAAWSMAGETIALLASMLIELSYWPEQVRSDKSPYEKLKELYNESLTDLANAIREENSGGEIGSGDNSGLPQYDFPEDEGGLVGWQTVW